MSHRPVSIQDIARAAGVSHSTVSRALRDSPLISLEVREQIQRIAREMGYTPNAIAQSLQMQQTNTIGLVVTSIADPFYGDLLRGIEEEAHKASLSVFLSAAHNDPAQEIAVIDTFHRRRVDGLLVAASRIGATAADALARVRVPTVLINSQAESYAGLLHSVTVDDYQGARLAVDHLLGLGHRAVGYIGSNGRPRSNRRRQEGYTDALADAQIAPQPGWITTIPPSDEPHLADVQGGRRALPELWRAGVSALFCYNDMVAIGALLACHDLGIAVPEQLSVVGFDDIETAQYVTPPLTSVHQPKASLGRMAMRMLLDLLHDRPAIDHVLLPTLMQRASTAPYQPNTAR